ncbi:unnamed protein product [Phytophthora fragariaefolia]|uniref:Unnamed protein product n=1 Tax=Phytophthora fragariaefolia TaxID=1490495 RepID=A0A9W6Y9W9_9STRA|nr:unnamed protein product [Phytophthora fragariaefolia]
MASPHASSSAPAAPTAAVSTSAASSSSPASNAVPLAPNDPVGGAQSAANEADPATDHDDAEAVAVPRCSTWFAMDKINPIEKRMLPEFFTASASKSAELYLKYRNYMVHAYRQQPGVYLTATACRRNLAGDACAILRVHEFLTHWGLINFHVPPHAMPPALHANYAFKAPERGAGQGPVAMLVAAKTENARRADVPLACEACGAARALEAAFFELSAEAKKKFTSNGAAAAAGSATPSTAGTNGKTAVNEGKEMTVGGFALRPGSGICEECYVRGAFPEGYDASDFVLMPTVAKNLAAKDKWTQEETDLLLEAVSSTRANGVKSPEGEDDDGNCDWNMVATKVGSKTADECLLHFLEMPLLNQADPSQGRRPNDSIQALRLFTAGEMLNAPVLDLVSLVEQVDPLVAKAAAHAAIGAIKRLHTMPVATKALQNKATSDSVQADGAGVKVEDNAVVGSAIKSHDASATSLEDAAAAVASSAEAAGIASTVKLEDTPADGDVAMEDVSSSTTTTESASKPKDEMKGDTSLISKEIIAVTEEAANATTIALLATRAQKIADDTAAGPVRELVNELLENQLRQMELKMQQLSLLEQTIIAEKEQLAKEKYQLYVDRLAFSQEKLNGRSA